MIKFIRQLLCKHEYKVSSSMKDIYGTRQHLQCEKCKHETVKEIYRLKINNK